MQLIDRNCTLCGPDAPKRTKYPATFSAEHFNALIFSARRMPDRVHFRLVECGGCGMIYSDPAAEPGSLASLYQESLVNYGSQESQIYESYRVVLDRALARTNRRGTFLEIGGGTGFMLRYGAENGFARQIEVEPSRDAEMKFHPPAKDAEFRRGIFVRDTLPKGSVSFACFFQMLDHVPDPLEFVSAVHEALEPGGVAVCVTHDTRAWSAKLLGEKSPIYDLEHTYLFNQENIASLFRKAGFSQTETFAVANNYALKYWMNLVPLPRALKAAAIAATSAIGLGDLRVKLYAGNLGIIAVK